MVKLKLIRTRRSVSLRKARVFAGVVLCLGLIAGGETWGQAPADSAGAGQSVPLRKAVKQTRSEKRDTVPMKSQLDREEGQLIELDEVRVHGEIAQPNVAITVSRAEPRFKEIRLERTSAEGLWGLEAGSAPGSSRDVQRPPWRKLVNRERQ